MVKVLVSILLLSSISASGNFLTDSTYQIERQKHFLGFSLGFTMTKLSGSEVDLMLIDPGSYQESKTGLDFALVYKFELSNFFYLKSGVGLTNKRSYFHETGFVYPVEAELKFINIPLILGFQPVNAKNSKRIKLAFESGLAGNFDSGSDEGNKPGLHPDNVVERKEFVPAFVAGANLEVRATKGLTIFMNFRYSKDLTDYYNRIYKWYDFDTSEYEYHTFSYRISSNHLTMGLLFNPKNF